MITKMRINPITFEQRTRITTKVSVLKEQVTKLPDNCEWYDSVVRPSTTIRILTKKGFDTKVSCKIRNFLTSAVDEISLEDLCWYICCVYEVTVYLKKSFGYENVILVLSN